MRRTIIPLLLSGILLLPAFFGCREQSSGRTVGSDLSLEPEEIPNDSSLKEVSRTVSAGKAKEIRTEIRFPAGKLNVTPGADRIIEGTYRFYLKRWVPVVTYEEEGQTGYLHISTEEGSIRQNYGNLDQCTWDIKVNGKVRNDVTIRCLAGEGSIDLHGCNLTRFDFTMTAGEMDIDLSNSSVPDVSFKALAGEAVIDLSGKWDNDMHASLQGGVGEMTLKLPADAGIRMEVHALIGNIDAPGLIKEGRFYTSESFGKTSDNFYIDFTAGIGNLEVVLVD